MDERKWSPGPLWERLPWGRRHPAAKGEASVQTREHRAAHPFARCKVLTMPGARLGSDERNVTC
jgi:hypothetical protein